MGENPDLTGDAAVTSSCKLNGQGGGGKNKLNKIGTKSIKISIPYSSLVVGGPFARWYVGDWEFESHRVHLKVGVR